MGGRSESIWTSWSGSCTHGWWQSCGRCGFQLPSRRMPTANAEGLGRIGRRRRKWVASVRRVFRHLQDRYRTSAFVVGMLRGMERKIALARSCGGWTWGRRAARLSWRRRYTTTWPGRRARASSVATECSAASWRGPGPLGTAVLYRPQLYSRAPLGVHLHPMHATTT